MSSTPTRARYGAEAVVGLKGQLPNPFPRTMGPNCMKYLQEVVDSGLTSPMIGRFEQAFAEAMGVRYCIATPGCTPALAVLAAAFAFEPGDEIIVSPVTDYGTVQGLIRENYIPVFADTEPGTVNLSADTIAPLVTDRTRALLVVHKTGLVCDMDPINTLAKKHGLIVYEDVCQAVFSRYKGRYAGALSHAAGYSFDSEKTMGSDIGGCVVTDDDALAERIRFIGQSRGGEMRPGFGRVHTEPGYAHRMTMCTAAISLAQLEILPDQVARRDAMIRLVSRLLSDIPGIHPLPIPDYQEVYSCWMAGFNIDKKAFRCDADTFAAQLAEAGIPGIGTGKYYLMPEALTFLQKRAQNQVYPFSLPPASRRYAYSADSCPVARDFLDTFIRWSTFCEKYEPVHCEQIAHLVRSVAERNRV
ncbi:MAG: DegT/DnrJ/EryC1/StrS family aminotransferase [candidate division Zixibacteria bacterium]|nr:DegT/DnrJ/EryC1/StrS family aminotransferase [candidate division Zixibacteria bacterium]